MVKKIGTRGALFTFDDETSVYLIESKTRLFLCDTHLGPESMAEIQNHIQDHGLGEKELVIFNSHSDWDHIWGSCAFEDAVIIGHEACRKRMMERAEYDLETFSEYQRGKVIIRYPNLTFQTKMSFEDDDIEFIYAPGHTIGSAICLDRRDSSLFVGDLLEDPVPILLHHDLQPYIETLKSIKAMSLAFIITGHSGVVNAALIDDTIGYLTSLIHHNPVHFNDEILQNIHNYNERRILLLEYEDKIRRKMGCGFDYRLYKQDFLNLFHIPQEGRTREYLYMQKLSPEDIHAAFEGYIAKL